MSVHKPTIISAPGSLYTLDCFHIVRERLNMLGYKRDAVPHPSCGAEPPITPLSDDVAPLRSALKDRAERSEETVLIAQSYRGIVGVNTVKHLGTHRG